MARKVPDGLLLFRPPQMVISVPRGESVVDLLETEEKCENLVLLLGSNGGKNCRNSSSSSGNSNTSVCSSVVVVVMTVVAIVIVVVVVIARIGGYNC